MKIGIVIGEFHKEIAEALLADAKASAKKAGVEVEVVWVPGSYEMLLPAKRFLQRTDITAVVILGFIEKGETLHGQEMGATVSVLLKKLELEYEKPVGMGIIGPGATPDQARKRTHYAGRAVQAALRMATS